MLALRAPSHRRSPPAGLGAPAAPPPPVIVVPGSPGGLPARPASPGLSAGTKAILAGFLYAAAVGGALWLYVRYLDATQGDRRDARRSATSKGSGGSGKTTHTKRAKETASTRGVGDFEGVLDHLRPSEVTIPTDQDAAFFRAAESRGYQRAGQRRGKALGVEKDLWIYKRG